MGIYSGEDAIAYLEAKQFRQAINEAYFGRTPGINRCFNAFCDFRHKYVDSSFLRGIKNIDADHDKDLRLFISEMERQFGFESFSFIISNSLTENMMTIPIMFHDGIPSKVNIKDWIVIDKEGYHFKDKARVSCIIIAYPMMLFDASMSDEEAFAIVLHEVGHNFQAFINGTMINMALGRSVMQIYTIIFSLISSFARLDFAKIKKITLTVLLSYTRTHSAASKLYNKLTSNTNRNNLYSYFNFVRGIMAVPKDVGSALITIPLAPIFGLISNWNDLVSVLNPIGIYLHSYDYIGERIADAFPSYYGFGNYMVSFNTNVPMGRPFGFGAKAVGSIPFIGHIYNAMLMPAYILSCIGDEHPADIVRSKSLIDSMKSDLSDPTLSPKLRANLKKEIDESEKLINEYFENAKATDPNITKILFEKWLFVTLNGGFKYKVYKSLFNINDEDINNKIRQESANFNDIL